MTHDLFLINLDRQGEAEAGKELGNLLITDTCEAIALHAEKKEGDAWWGTAPDH